MGGGTCDWWFGRVRGAGGTGGGGWGDGNVRMSFGVENQLGSLSLSLGAGGVVGGFFI